MYLDRASCGVRWSIDLRTGGSWSKEPPADPCAGLGAMIEIELREHFPERRSPRCPFPDPHRHQPLPLPSMPSAPAYQNYLPILAQNRLTESVRLTEWGDGDTFPDRAPGGLGMMGLSVPDSEVVGNGLQLQPK